MGAVALWLPPPPCGSRKEGLSPEDQYSTTGMLSPSMIWMSSMTL